MMSLLFPILPKQPGLTLQYCFPPPHYPASNMIDNIGRGLVNLNIKLKTFIRCKKWKIGDLGWGFKTRHLVFVLLFFWGGNYATSRKPARVYIYTYIGN